MAGLLLAIIYLAFISLGLPDSLVGTAWPEMYQVLGVNVSALGIITMITSACTIISAVFSDKLAFKLGAGLVTAISTLMVGCSMLLYGFVDKFYLLCLLAIPYGLGAGAIDSSLNNYAALHYSSRAMSFLHSFWGVGAFISPYIMGYALTNNDYSFGFLIVAIIQIALAVLFFLVLPLWKKCEKKNVESKEEVEQSKLTFKEKFKISGVILFFIAFLAHNAIECTLIQWNSSYFVLSHSLSTTSAAELAAFYFIGLSVSRMLTGIFAADKISDKNMIRIGAAIEFVGIILLCLPFDHIVYCYVAIGLVGFGVGPIYPAFIHSTPTKFGKQNSLAVIGLLMAFGYIGSTLMPPVYGLLADYVSPDIYPFFLLFFLIIMIVLSEILIKKLKGKHYN